MLPPEMKRHLRKLSDSIVKQSNKPQQNIPRHDIVWGVVAVIDAGPPITLEVNVGGAAVTSKGIRYLSSYVPTVGDTVMMSWYGTDLVVLGSISPAATAGGYKSLTGAGETATPGFLNQIGGFEVDAGTSYIVLDSAAGGQGISITNENGAGIQILDNPAGSGTGIVLIEYNTGNYIRLDSAGTIVLERGAEGVLMADSTGVSFNGSLPIFPPQATTASAPAYARGGMYFDLTLNKLRIGGATGWETVTSA